MGDRSLKTIGYVTRRFNSLQGLRLGVPVGAYLVGCGAALGIGRGYLEVASLAGLALLLWWHTAAKKYYAARFGIVRPAPAGLQSRAGKVAVPGPAIATPWICRQWTAPWFEPICLGGLVGLVLLGLWWNLRDHAGPGSMVSLLYAAASVVFFILSWVPGNRHSSQARYLWAGFVCVWPRELMPASLTGWGPGGIGGWFVVVGLCFLGCGIADHLLLVRVLGPRGEEE